LIVQGIIQILAKDHEDREDRREEGDQKSHDEGLNHSRGMRYRLETMI
jgi:hypothetical protein